MTESVEIYTDGACKGNPGIGGWGALLRFAEAEKEIFGGEPMTTNNRMELRAVIEALTLSSGQFTHAFIPIPNMCRRASVNGWVRGSVGVGERRTTSP